MCASVVVVHCELAPDTTPLCNCTAVYLCSLARKPHAVLAVPVPPFAGGDLVEGHSRTVRVPMEVNDGFRDFWQGADRSQLQPVQRQRAIGDVRVCQRFWKSTGVAGRRCSSGAASEER